MDAKNLRSIVVATDLAPASDRVVRAAASIAALTGAELHVVHVLAVPAAGWPEGETLDPGALAGAEAELETQLRRATPAAFSPASTAVATGPSPAEAIRRHVREVAAELVVLGPHRAGEAEDRAVLGATADRVVRTARVPCLVVRGALEFPVRRVGVLSDFSPASRAALETAAAWIRAFSGGEAAGVAVAHVARTAGVADHGALEASRLLPELRALLERAAPEGERGAVEYHPEVLWADQPAGAAAAWARERGLGLVVLGTQGAARHEHGDFGSVASAVARTSPISVLLVPPGYAPAPARAGAGEVRLRTVVTGVDLHESSWEGALWAMRCLAPDAEHELLHVLELPDLPGPLRGLGGARERLRVGARNTARRRLAELAELGTAPRVGTHVREGRPAAEIVRLAGDAGADLIVVGEQGTRRGVGALLGSTAERVLFGSRLPVLLARKVGDSPPRRLLVAVDPSEATRRVLAWTAYLAERFDATVTVLNVVDRLLLADEVVGLPAADTLRRLEEEAVTAMRGWLAEEVGAAGLRPERLETRVVVGDPAYEIVAGAARGNAELVVLGSKGGDIALTPLAGRIVNKVVRSAPCSVLVARG